MEGEGAHPTFPAEPPTAERRQAMDIVLECLLEAEDRHRGAFASSGDREKALLVLKQVPVLEDDSLEGITDFQGSTAAKDGSPVVFEASGKRCLGFLVGTAQFPVPPLHTHFPSAGPANITPVCHSPPQWTWYRSPRQRLCSTLIAAGGR